MAVVETRDLTKVFKEGALGAVNSVSLETREGEFLVFLGPSGSGKTTLLRMIAGLEAPTSGDILIGGRVVNDLTPRERRIAMVFQSYALYPHLSVYKNIAFPLKAQKIKKELHQAKVEWAAALLGIGALLERKPRELSGGERQRVALARAIVREPAVFLLDEPLSNLDAKLRASAREELERFHRRVGTTTIYVTHDQVEAMAMGDRVLVLNKGVVHQLGTPTEVYDHPADTFVAAFLGSPPMNLVELAEHIVGFRPEHLRPASSVTGDAVSLRLRVENIEYLGAEWIVSGSVGGGRLDGKKVFSRLTSAQGLALEGTYDFAVPQRELRFFDRSTEKRVAPRAVSLQ
ncbi:MAG: ATP-binding cassette domain-containing protein [Gammaproteobacteria bacterium]|nr:MAG: ATP-binding cassette domain-containing protein [Gammaproteobacteria bacterium]TLY97129.1 MAG: ATP-binding cassette domain-containing protein [Gammaproteobacteria bacterium]